MHPSELLERGEEALKGHQTGPPTSHNSEVISSFQSPCKTEYVFKKLSINILSADYRYEQR